MTLAQAPNQAPLLQPHRFTVEQYHNMIQSGVFQEDDRIELLNGEVVDMSPIGLKHCRIVDQLTRYLTRAPDKDPIVRVQNAIHIPEYSQPQPDLTVVRFRADFYENRLPGPSDILLLIEVADSSLAIDCRIKIPLYAGAGIPEVWIVDIVGNSIQVLTSPANAAYANTRTLKSPQSIAPAAFPNYPLSLADLFPN